MPPFTERFTHRVEIYDQFRPRYPSAKILATLRDWADLSPDFMIADVGAGTGMLTEVFLRNGNVAIAIEPNAEMRQFCQRLQAIYPALEVLNATAEITTLADHSIDMVTVGRAFHWFDQEKAIDEFCRILRPNRWIALVAVGRSRARSALIDSYEQILQDFGEDYDPAREDRRSHEGITEYFKGAEVRQEITHDVQQLTLAQFIGQTLSLSMAPLAQDPRHPLMVSALTQLHSRFCQGDLLSLPTTCWLTCARFDSSRL